MSGAPCPIWVIGSGRAAILHLNAYLRLWEAEALPQIYIVPGPLVHPQIRTLAENYPENIHLTTLKETMRRKQIDSVIDICTPTPTHRTVLEELYDVGFCRFLVEKPLVTAAEDLERIRSLPIQLALMQNYLFSRATGRALDLIRSGEIHPASMISVFSKDRTVDSVAMRGFYNGEPPHVFTIELPHQLYLAAAFLGPARVVTARSGNMVIDGKPLPHHGAGIIQLEHEKPGKHAPQVLSSFHFSCLTSANPVRRVLLTGRDQRTLTIDYPAGQSGLTSKIELRDGNGSVRTEPLENDDMIKFALQHYYAVLSQDPPDSFPLQCGVECCTQLVIDALQNQANQT